MKNQLSNPRRRNLVFVNYIHETFTPTKSGALATIIWELCKVASSQGIDPFVLSRTASVASFNLKNLVDLRPVAKPTNRVSKFYRRLERKLTGWREWGHREWATRVAQAISRINSPDPCLVLLNEPEIAVYLRRRFPNARIIHWFQNQQTSSTCFRDRLKIAADVVLGVSDFTSRWVEEHYGIEKNGVRTLYNATDIEHFKPGQETEREKPVIGFVGRTGIEKGPDILLKAAILLARDGLQFELQLIGSNHWDRFELDEYQVELSTHVETLEAMGVTVRRPGHIDRLNLPREIRRADIHVMSSRWAEPFGMATLEGMACGLATVASATGGTPEVVGNAAHLFQSDNVSGLAACLKPLVENRALRRNQSVAARTQACQFTWQRCWETLQSAIGEPLC